MVICFQVTSGFQWYLQVIYSIGPTDLSLFHRRKRSALLSLDKNKRSVGDNSFMKYDWLENSTSKNGTNIQILHLNKTQILQTVSEESESVNLTAVFIPILSVIVIAVVIVVILVRRKRRRKRYKHSHHQPLKKRNNLELAQQNSVIYKGSKYISVRTGPSLELKESVVFKGEPSKTAVRVKNTNIVTDKNIMKGNGTEV